jgi:hypothetical protein
MKVEVDSQETEGWVGELGKTQLEVPALPK